MPLQDDTLRTNEDRITWVLDHPRMSLWLKTALKSALERNPIALLNDLEILNQLLQEYCLERIKAASDRRSGQ